MPLDWLMVADAKSSTPRGLFTRLRWGGQAVLFAKTPAEANELVALYRSRDEWRIDVEPERLELRARDWWRPWATTHGYALVVRKVLLELPEEPTLRHSYDVRLEPWPGVPGGYCVQKRVPMPEQIARRLQRNFAAGDRPEGEALTRAIDKLRKRVFPLFLTREAGFLKILQRDLPESLRASVPDVLDLEYGEKGYVCCLRSRWLRLGGEPIGPLAFARQASALVRSLHESARVVHLDLRLDNFLITEGGVKVVDFGSALRRGEDITRSGTLVKLFTEMLGASQIRKDLVRMLDKRYVRSSAFAQAYAPPGPSADLFSLVNNFGRLDQHPDFRGLIRPSDEEDAFLSLVRREVFRPKDPAFPGVYRVRDLAKRLNDESPRPIAVPLLKDGPVEVALAGTSETRPTREAAKPSLPFSLAKTVATEDAESLDKASSVL